MKNVYRNKLRSRQLIRDAVISLLDKKGNISLITVSDVVETANINRGTFYNNYNNVIEVLEEMKEERINTFLQELKKITSMQDLEGFINTLVKHFKENEKNYRKIVNGVSISMIDDLKIEFVKQVLISNSKINAFNLSFVVNALTGMYLDYLKNNSEFSLEEIGKRTIEILNKIFDI